MITIIGGGFAGLSAAYFLHRAGKDVTVLEWSRGLGGRAATRNVGYRTVDSGAQRLDLSPLSVNQLETDARALLREVAAERGALPYMLPYDPVNDMASIDYAKAEARGYFKLDLLNVHVYSQVRDEAHLKYLMREPNWDMLLHKETVEQLIHLGNHFYSIQRMPDPINSIPRLAMFLAIIRPAKKHLIGQSWSDVSKQVWEKDMDGGYSFKRSHSVGYAHLVVVHMNLLREVV